MPAALVSPTTPSPSAYRVDDQSLCSTPMQYAANADGIPSPASTVRPKDTPRLRKTQQREVASDFLALHAQGRAHTHAFRVHSPVSAPNSTLIWSGYPATSGFFPYNEHLAITPAVYLSTIVPGTAESRTTGRRYGHEGRVGAITATVWEHGPYVRHTMVDHINGKMRQGLLNIPSRLEERPGTPEDEKSPWVSGTRSVMWAIWEVARRLAWGEEAVGLTVIRCEPAAEVIQQESSNGLENGEAGTSESELESWRRAEDTRRRSYIGREVLINPLKPIAAALASGRGGGSMSVSMREAYELALRSARESEEVLWYGRVFAESIARNLDFTCHEDLPIELPVQFWQSRSSLSAQRGRLSASGPVDAPGTPPRPFEWDSTAQDREAERKQNDTGGRAPEGWLNRLVWDPRKDDYERAVQKVVERRRQVSMSRGVSREGCPMTPI